MRCGLTPTDFMHIKGDYDAYDAEASALAARYLLRRLEREDTPALEALAGEVYGLVGGRLYENLLRILLAQQYPAVFERGLGDQALFLIREAWAKRGAVKDALCRYGFGTTAALVGIGAPAHVFLPAVAEALGAGCILPENAEVANALGALKADINTVARVEISQMLSSEGRLYYLVHGPAGSARFDDLDEATAAAKAASEASALKEARSRGALGQLAVNTVIEERTAQSKWGSDVRLGRTAVSEVTVRFG